MVHCMLVVAAKRKWVVHQLDVNNAFLRNDLIEDVYMQIPQGFTKKGDTQVRKLKKSLYDLKRLLTIDIISLLVLYLILAFDSQGPIILYLLFIMDLSTFSH